MINFIQSLYKKQDTQLLIIMKQLYYKPDLNDAQIFMRKNNTVKG